MVRINWFFKCIQWSVFDLTFWDSHAYQAKMKLLCLLTIVLFAVVVTSRPQKKEGSESTKKLTAGEILWLMILYMKSVFQLFDTICISFKNIHTEQICSLESSDGNCEAYYPKFFFNSKVGRCELFLYGGCGGNDNRFTSLRECESKCGIFKLKKSNWMPINTHRFTTMSTNLRLFFFFYVIIRRQFSTSELIH